MSWSRISTFTRKHADEIDYQCINLIWCCININALLGALKFAAMMGWIVL
jgi:hypothetical protein